jgi:hypothetical protein
MEKINNHFFRTRVHAWDHFANSKYKLQDIIYLTCQNKIVCQAMHVFPFQALMAYSTLVLKQGLQ